MVEYLEETLNDIYQISENSKNEFNKRYDEIVSALQKGFAQTNIETDYFYLYPVGEYDYGTSLEELAPYKIVFEYTCKKSKLVKKINFLKMKNKKRQSMKNKILMDSIQNDADDVFTNFELAQIIENLLKKSKLSLNTTIKQNSVFVRITENGKIYDFVIIIAYKFENEDNLNNENNSIIFKYKTQNFELNYEKYYQLLDNKMIETNDIFRDMIVLFKYFEFSLLINETINHKTLTEFNLYENLFYNIPNNLFVKNLYDAVINCTNYLSNINVKTLKTVDGKNLINNKSDLQTYKNLIYLICNNVTLFVKSIEMEIE